MVFHILLFRPRTDLPAIERSAVMRALAEAQARIPTIRRVSLGRRVTHGRGYEPLMREDFPYAAVLEFDDLDGLKEYLQHPAHEELGSRFMEMLEAGAIYDYEMWEGSAIASVADAWQRDEKGSPASAPSLQSPRSD